ncbi:MAG: hypothetical protein DSZ12_01325 [Sulfurovum sp.]|nr:MAG: hypothetical protein DSZ12_01325 [Sulfurovum sp.]
MKYVWCMFLPLLLLSKPFKVASYNVENLFDMRYQGSEYEEYIPEKHHWNRRMMEIKLNHIAEVICDVDADIIALQEVENERIFKKLQERLQRVGCPYKYGAITHKKNAPIQIAVLSRFRIQKQREIKVGFSSKIRNILEVEVKVEDKTLTLFINHWKSKSRKGYESKRIRYAKALQARIAQFSLAKEYIILGDLNSPYNAYLSLENNLNDTKGKTAVNDILRTNIGTQPVDKQYIIKAKKGIHYNLWNELTPMQRWNHQFRGKKSNLDHFVLPSNMFDGKGIEYVNNSFGVFKKPYLFTKRGHINAWQYTHGKHKAKGYSDHLPIYAYFDTKAYTKETTKSLSSTSVPKQSIEDLYQLTSLDAPIVLEDIKVMFKRADHAVIKQKPLGRGIYLYACAKDLKEGHCYDIEVKSITTYKGLKEITEMNIVKEKETTSLEAYYRHQNTLEHQQLEQNEVIKDIEGIYKNHFFILHGQKFPIYFKNKKSIPQNDAHIKIDYAHLGYYKRLQLVVYSPKDFIVLEK